MGDEIRNTNVIEDRIFDFIFVMAMRDAVMQKAYKGEKAWLWDLKNCSGWKRPLKGFVDQCLKGDFDDQLTYDKSFMETAAKIKASINEYEKKHEGSGPFTFGNAQKLINMTMKYFYIASYNNPELRGRFQCCHCPMDGIMLKKIYDLKKDELESGFLDGWSKEESKHERYDKFQELVTKLAYPKSRLEYDFENWP